MEQANGARLLFSLIRMRRQLAPVLDAGFGGLSRAEYLVLRGVARGRFGGRGEPVRAAKLSEMLEVSRPAVTRVLNGLESRGLITRSIDRDDRRSINVELTEAGRKALGSADEEIPEHGRKARRAAGGRRHGKAHRAARPACGRLQGLISRRRAGAMKKKRVKWVVLALALAATGVIWLMAGRMNSRPLLLRLPSAGTRT